MSKSYWLEKQEGIFSAIKGGGKNEQVFERHI